MKLTKELVDEIDRNVNLLHSKFKPLLKWPIDHDMGYYISKGERRFYYKAKGRTKKVGTIFKVNDNWRNRHLGINGSRVKVLRVYFTFNSSFRNYWREVLVLTGKKKGKIVRGV